MKTARAIAILFGLVATTTVFAAGRSAQAANTRADGAPLFKEHCSMCHLGEAAKGNPAPTTGVLSQKSQEEILRALESGAMVIYGNRMTGVERRAVAAFLSSDTSNSTTLA